MTVHMMIELNEADEAQLRAIADYEQVSPEQVVKKVLSERLEYDRWFRAAVAEGRASATRGEVYDHDDVFTELYARIERETASSAE